MNFIILVSSSAVLRIRNITPLAEISCTWNNIYFLPRAANFRKNKKLTYSEVRKVLIGTAQKHIMQLFKYR